MGLRREGQTEYSRPNSGRIGNSGTTSPIFDLPILYHALVALMTSRGATQCAHSRCGPSAAGLEMVAHYAQLEDIDLLQAHREHSPIDRL